MRASLCFKPKPPKTINAGMAAGAAVGVFLACTIIAIGGFAYYRPELSRFSAFLSDTQQECPF